MNSGYRDQIPAIKEHFEQVGSVSLQQFFCQEDFENILEKISTLNFTQNKKLMHHQYTIATEESLSKLLLTQSVCSFIKELTGTEPTINGECIALQHRDFKLRVEHDKSTYLLLFTVNEWPESCGGDIFVVDNNEDALHVPRTENTLSIIKIDKGYQEFFTYVNHYAQNPRVLFRLLL